ncbi:hypothetical protein SteCoe_9357 [Stentor coeruleus]|uniref:Uncharacterized protein n=1 Tax=Stentor coeruleus TaxID=5963 RepID=A0A1R2CHZ7_9CILI|nr:hypothetical protein SteCoe_9357 [Stentor coeruleus]
MQESRGNIMNRKPKAYNGRNETSGESEHAAEQARIEALRNRKDQMQEHRRVTHHGSTQEKSELKARIGQDAQFQLYMKDQKTQEERKRSDMENEAMENHRRMVVEMERQREMEKKQRLRETQEANRLAAMAKKTTSLEKKVSGDMQDRDTIQDNIYKYQPNVF